MRNIQPYKNKMYLVYPMKHFLYQIVEFSCDSDKKLVLCIFYLVRKLAKLIKWIIYVQYFDHETPSEASCKL